MRSADRTLRLTFSYWGRRGLSAFALGFARAARRQPNLQAALCVARQNDRFADFLRLDGETVAIDTFSSIVDLPVATMRLPLVRRRLLRHIVAHRPHLWIELLPHLFTPVLMPALIARGVRYVTMIHDALPHPGDLRSAAAFWYIKRAIHRAHALITLSEYVTAQLRFVMPEAAAKIATLSLPDFDLGVRRPATPPAPYERWRLLFLGRLLPYKGLSLCLDMVETLRARGVGIDLTVAGSGSLGVERKRLAAVGARVINRWLRDEEIGKLLVDAHAVVLSHVEASQSGIAATASAAAVPVIATPVGGLREQVQPEITGVLAARVDGAALADAASGLLADPARYRALCARLESTRASRSMESFVARCLERVGRIIGDVQSVPP